MNIMSHPIRLSLQFKTRKEIAAEFGISERTFRRWLKRERLSFSGRLLSPSDQMQIYETFHWPASVSQKHYRRP